MTETTPPTETPAVSTPASRMAAAAAIFTRTNVPAAGSVTTTEPKPTEATTKTEAAPAETKAEEKPKETDSSRFAALAKRERGLVLKTQDLSTQREAVKADKEALAKDRESFAKEKAEFEEWKRLRADAKLRPLDYLKAGGLSYEETTQAALEDGKPSAAAIAKTIDDRLAAQKAELLEAQKLQLAQEKERIASEQKAQFEEFRIGVVDFVKSNAAEYELTNLHDDGPGLVAEVIREAYEMSVKSGKPRIMDAKEAAERVEKYYEQQAEKLSATKKWQARVQAQSLVKEPEKRPEPAQQRTLTNGLTASTHALTASEAAKTAWERAMAKLSG